MFNSDHPWHCFEDADYYLMWCVTPVDNLNLNAPRYYLPETEAKALTKLLNSYHTTLVIQGSETAQAIAKILLM